MDTCDMSYTRNTNTLSHLKSMMSTMADAYQSELTEIVNRNDLDLDPEVMDIAEQIAKAKEAIEGLTKLELKLRKKLASL